MKALEMRDMTTEELVAKEQELRAELFNLRFQLATGQLENSQAPTGVRRDIARIKTELRQRAELVAG